ncbi:MAG TPA: outer membrane beta-barrel protein [Daejeonella sp.]|nr:outer membrane beta-barrel protein [Daejeonella sp.]
MKIYLLLLTCCLSLSLKAQTSTANLYEIKGTVADSSTRKPLDYVTIGLQSVQKQPIKSTLSKPDGSFSFSTLKPAKYFIAIVSVGYQSKTMEIDLTSKARAVKDLGIIYINTKTNKLNEVVITADKPLIKQEVDRITYDLQADPESKTNSVMEMMRKVPLLSVDAEDNILLKGNANYKILINGKPSGMMERNPKDILKSMPASSIQNIEVITSPSSKYDAEGLAGIINIITNKKVDNGYNGSLNLSERFPVGGPGIGGSFTFKQGKLGISAYSGGSIYNTPSTITSNNRATTGINHTNLSQLSERYSDSGNGYFGTEISFEIDSLNLVTAQFGINGNQSEGLSNQSSLLNGQEGILQSYNIQNNNDGNGKSSDASLNYQRGFKGNKNRLLTFSYRYYGYENEQNAALITSTRINYEVPDYKQFNIGGTDEQTFQIDYVHPFKKLNIEGGVKGIHRRNHSDFHFRAFNSQNDLFELDPSRTNLFNNTQDVLGAYNTYQYNLKNWGFKAGFRMEKTIIHADFISSVSKVNQEYFNVVPTINMSRKFKNMSSINFSFTQRIQRPGIYQLNPFVDRSNPNLESTGNPDLHPTVGNMFQLGYNKSKKSSINLVLGYTFFDDLIMPVSAFDPITYVTRSSYDNTGKARLINTNLNLNYPISRKWSLNFNAGLAHGHVEGLVNGILVKNEGFMYNISSSSSYRFEKGWRINANMYLNGPNLALQGTSNSYISSSFSVNKDIVKDKLSFSAAANNPFRKYRINRKEIFGPDFFQTSDNQAYYRSFHTSLNYRFGKLKEAMKKNKRNINNDDVSNSASQ